jgi:iron complex transport system substrate-binding protein
MNSIRRFRPEKSFRGADLFLEHVGSNLRHAERWMVLAVTLLLLPACQQRSGSPPAENTGAGSAITLVDAMGRSMRLDLPVRRVISTAPNLTEIAFAVGGGDRLVGRTKGCDYPPETSRIPIIGDYKVFDYEKMIALKPDLILMTFAGNEESSYRKLLNLGLKVFTLDATTIGTIVNALDTVGLLLGKKEEAAVLSARLRGEIDSIRTLAEGKPPVSAFIVIDKSPLITVSRGFLDEAIRIAGGVNIAAGAAESYPQFSREALITADPEVILLPAGSISEIGSLLEANPDWRGLRAVRNHRVYAIPADIISRPGPRIVQGVRLIYQALHGANPDSLFPRSGTSSSH